MKERERESGGEGKNARSAARCGGATRQSMRICPRFGTARSAARTCSVHRITRLTSVSLSFSRAWVRLRRGGRGGVQRQPVHRGGRGGFRADRGECGFDRPLEAVELSARRWAARAAAAAAAALGGRRLSNERRRKQVVCRDDVARGVSRWRGGEVVGSMSAWLLKILSSWPCNRASSRASEPAYVRACEAQSRELVCGSE